MEHFHDEKGTAGRLVPVPPRNPSRAWRATVGCIGAEEDLGDRASGASGSGGASRREGLGGIGRFVLSVVDGGLVAEKELWFGGAARGSGDGEGGGDADVIEDFLDDGGVGDEGQDDEGGATSGAQERVDVTDPSQQLGPPEGARPDWGRRRSAGGRFDGGGSERVRRGL